MDSTRQKKIGRLIQKEVSDIFQREAKEFLMGTLVSVTSVRVSPDLGLARIYVSIFPGKEKGEVFKNININGSRIRYLLGQRVGKQLRVIPEVQFFIDDSLDYIERIDTLLKQ